MAYSINDNLKRADSIISDNVYAVNHKDYVKGEVVSTSYGQDSTTLHSFIVLVPKTTSAENPYLTCIVGGTFNIGGLDEASNTENNLTALATNNIYGIKG